MSFVASDTSSYGPLDYPKSDLNPLGPGEDPTKFILASSWNPLNEAVHDTKQGVISGSLFGFREAPGPLSFISGSGVFMWAASGNLNFNRFGITNKIAHGPVVSKGDVLVYDGTTFVVLSTGSAGSVLTVDSLGLTGVKWVTGNLVDVESFRQVGFTDSQTIQAAVNSGLPLTFPRRTYVISSGSSIINATCPLMYGNETILTVTSGAIVNTDTNHVEHVPIMQVRGLPRFSMLGSWIVDGNRDSMTYPTGTTDFGRGTLAFGSAGRRTNAQLEFVPGADNATPCRNIYIENMLVRNSYQNGLVFWQTSGSVLNNVKTENSTFNGFVSHGVTNWTEIDCEHRRDGVSSAVPTTMLPAGFGDRCGTQVREIPANFTAALLNMPSIPVPLAANGMVNYGVHVIRGFAEECNVESYFLRSCFPGTITNTVSRNVGYTRVTGSWFIPSHFWVEAGFFRLNDLVAVQTTDNSGSGWQRPTVLNMQAFGGIGTNSAAIPINVDGVFPLVASNIQGVCGRNSAGLKMRNFDKGLRVRSNMMLNNVFVEGCSDVPIYVDDDTNFENIPPHMITLRDVRVENWDAPSALSFNKFGTVSGSADGIVVDGFTSRDGHTALASTDDHALIDFALSMATVNTDGLQLLRLDMDCTNTGSAQNYNGVRLRIGSGSKNVKIDFASCNSPFTAVRVGGSGNGGVRNLSVRGNVDLATRLFLIDQAGSSTAIESLDVRDMFTSGTVTEFFNFMNMSTGSITSLRVQGNRFGGSAHARTFPVGAGRINTGSNTFFVEASKFIWKDNLDEYGSAVDGLVFDMRRRFSVSGSLLSVSPNYLGEIAWADDSSTWLGIDPKTTGSWARQTMLGS